MSPEIVKLNWFELQLSKNEINIQSIEFRNDDNLASFRSKFDQSHFLRYKDRVYIWESIRFQHARVDSISTRDDQYLICRVLSESMISQFFEHKEFYVSNSIGGYKVIDYRTNLSDVGMPYLEIYNSYQINFSPLQIQNDTKVGFNITSNLYLRMNWTIDDFLKNGLSIEGLVASNNGYIKIDSTSLYRVANFYGHSSRVKALTDQLSGESESILNTNSFVEEFFRSKLEEFKLPDTLRILKIDQIEFIADEEAGFFELAPPKNYFYRNTTPGVGTEGYAMRSKIKYNKPVSYDLFENRTIRIGVIYPEDYYRGIAQFIKVIQEELNEIYGVPIQKILYKKIPIEDSQLASYQAGLQNANDIDIAIIVVEEDHELLTPQKSPYYFCKAEFIKRGINSQQVQIQQVFKFLNDRSAGLANYADHTFALNIYAKLGGTAWTIKPQGDSRNELVFGVGATTNDEGLPFIGMTSVFRGDGQYLIGDISAVAGIDDYNIYLSRIIRKSIKKCLDLQIITREKTIYLVFHLFKKPGMLNEISALTEAILGFENIDFKYTFVYIGDGHNFRASKYQVYNHQKLIKTHLQRGTVIKVNSNLSFIVLKKKGGFISKIEIDNRSNVIDIGYSTKQVYDFASISHSSFNAQSSPASIKYSKLIALMSLKLKSIDGFYMSQISMPDNTPWFL